MTWTEQAALTTYVTPEDGALVVPALTDLLAGGLPGYGLRWSVYSDTLPAFYSGVEAAAARGQILLGVFDHVQGCNRVAAEYIGQLIAAVGHEPVSIGTSMYHAIAHQKTLVQNLALTDEQRAAQAALPAFTDWRAALKAGQAVTWTGSWNFDVAALKQINHVDVVPSAVRAASFGAAIQAHHDWIRTNEPTFQRLARLFVTRPAAAADPRSRAFRAVLGDPG